MTDSGHAIDKNSPTWWLVRDKATAIIAAATKVCVRKGVDQRDADEARGRIRAAEEILALPVTQPSRAAD